MEDLRREFQGEGLQQSETEEQPPRRPGKLPAGTDSGDSSATPMDRARKQHRPQPAEQTLDRRHTHDSASPAGSSRDAGDAGIDGSDRLRSKKSRSGAPKVDSAEENAGSVRPSQSRDDMDVMRRTSGLTMEEDQHLHRELDQLRRRLKEANSRAEQAERSVTEIDMQTRGLSESMDVLKRENKKLETELDEARSHIFSLQPYRKDLTPDEVGREFEDLIDSVTDWVIKLMGPIAEDSARMDDIVAQAKKKSESSHMIRKMMHKHGDIANGTMFPDTDIDIVNAIVMRFVYEKIFEETLYGTQKDLVAVLTFIEGSMTTNVKPTRDLIARRTWRAEAYSAIISSPDFAQAREKRLEELTIELLTILAPFYKSKDYTKNCYSAQDAIIRRAIALQEKLITSTHHFYLDLDPYIVWNQRRELEISGEFLKNLHEGNLHCENILANRKAFVLAKLDPKPTPEQLVQGLTLVATVAPGLYMRRVGKGDTINDAIMVRKQHVLVAWGDQEKRKRLLDGADPTLMYQIYHARRPKQEKASDSMFGGWRSVTLG
ncbi:hypothetical protein GQ53DRAFT_132698 [Thozetella sp. PMI_491]|nr:hypothetical protein GQ53DRAFT_132698 [Thozetella sp. PMI_491]